MARYRMSIRLRPDEHDLLRRKYLERRIPIDQFEKRPEDLARFMSEWNRLSDRDDTSSEVLHYMRNRRKCGKWPKLNGDHERCPPIPDSVLTEAQWTELESVYAEKCIAEDLGSDAISHDEDLAREVSDEFARRTGLRHDGRFLHTLLMQRRKRKRLPRIRDDVQRRPDIGFGDIDDIAN